MRKSFERLMAIIRDTCQMEPKSDPAHGRNSAGLWKGCLRINLKRLRRRKRSKEEAWKDGSGRTEQTASYNH